MNWNVISSKFDRVRAGDTDLQKKIRGLRRRLTLLLAVVGPGLITSNVDNDAGEFQSIRKPERNTATRCSGR